MKTRVLLKRLSVLSASAILVGLVIAAVLPPCTVPIDGTFGTTFKLIPTAAPGVFGDPIEGIGKFWSLMS